MWIQQRDLTLLVENGEYFDFGIEFYIISHVSMSFVVKYILKYLPECFPFIGLLFVFTGVFRLGIRLG